MGQSTNGIIAYGSIFEEGFEFPWDDDKYDFDIGEWWECVMNYEPIYQPWTESGGYAPGWVREDPRFTEYFQHKRDWLKENPLPVAVENYCHGDYPMYALVIPTTVITALRGDPESFDPRGLCFSATELHDFKKFMDLFEISYEEPQWLLMSYWG